MDTALVVRGCRLRVIIGYPKVLTFNLQFFKTAFSTEIDYCVPSRVPRSITARQNDPSAVIGFSDNTAEIPQVNGDGSGAPIGQKWRNFNLREKEFKIRTLQRRVCDYNFTLDFSRPIGKGTGYEIHYRAQNRWMRHQCIKRRPIFSHMTNPIRLDQNPHTRLDPLAKRVDRIEPRLSQ